MTFPFRAAVAAAVAVLAAGLVYLNALDNPYVYDDFRTILSNSSLGDLRDWRSVVLFDLTRPVTNISFAIDHALWRSLPFGFHATSVLLHLLNTALVFVLAWQLTADGARVRAWSSAPHAPVLAVAFMTAALFAVHPLMTESVAYISSRSDVLVTTSLLGAFLLARRWMLGGGLPSWLGAVALWFVGLATKETAAVWPALLVAYDALFANREDRRRRIAWLHAPVWIVALSAAGWRTALFIFQEHAGAATLRWQSIAEQLDVVRRYAALILAPGGQSIFHAPQSVHSIVDATVIGGVATVGALLAAVWWLRSRSAAASFGLVWFLVSLAPAAVLYVLGHGEAMAEHRAYTASIGAFLALSTAMAWVANLPGLSTPRLSWLYRLAFVSVLLSLSGRTLARNFVWSDSVALWSEAVERAPGAALPHTVLGESLHAAGQHERAIAEYRKAIAITPSDDGNYLKLATCLLEQRQVGEAARALDDLERAAPESRLLPSGRGMVALLSGRIDDARQIFEQALTGGPDDVLALRWLAVLEEDYAHRPAAALARCRELSRYLPMDPANRACMERNEGR